MSLSNIESKINELLTNQYGMEGISLTSKDKDLVCYAIRETDRNGSIEAKLSRENIEELSEQIITIAHKVSKARFACLKLGISNLASPENSLFHLSALDDLLLKNDIQAPREITGALIVEHIISDRNACIESKVIKLGIHTDIAEFIKLVINLKATITPTEEPKPQAQTSVSLFSMQTRYVSKQTCYAVGVACVGVTAAAYGLYQQYVAPTEESTPLNPGR